MDMSNYRRAKLAGRIVNAKYGDSFQCTQQRFRIEDGTLDAPTISTFSRSEIITQRDMLVTALAECNALLADIDAL